MSFDAVRDVCIRVVSGYHAAVVTSIRTLRHRRLPLAPLSSPPLGQSTPIESLEFPSSLSLALLLVLPITVARALDTPANSDLHASLRANTLATSEDLEQLGSLHRNLVVGLLEATRFDVQEVLLSDLSGCAREERAEVGLAIEFASLVELETRDGRRSNRLVLR